MKIRSKAFFEYLNRANLLNGSDEAIAKAKREFRKQYKKQWKQRRIKQKDLRPAFTLAEYEIICQKAKKAGVKPTTFARQVMLETLSEGSLIPQKEVLLQILQYLSIACIELSKAHAAKSILDPLEKAEAMLLKYIHHDTENYTGKE